MAVKIRLKRLGKIRSPHYRVVVIDGRKARNGRAIEEIGRYVPTSNPSLIEIDSDRAQYWLSVGAQPSDQVRKLLELTGDWATFKGEKGESTVEVAAPKEAYVADDSKASVITEKTAPAPEAASAAPAAAEPAPEQA